MARISEQQLTVDARTVRVWTGGQGPALVLLHGGLGDAALHFQDCWQALADHYRVISPDLPGFGGSAALEQPTWQGLLRWLDQILDALDAASVVVVGNSFGGAFARAYGANRPDRVHRVVLVNGGMLPVLSPLTRRIMAMRTVLAPLNALMRWMTYSRTGLGMMVHQKHVLTDRFVERARQEAPAFVDMMNLLFSSAPPDSTVPEVPTVLIWGDHDRFTPERVARQIEREVGAQSIHMVQDCGHMPQSERPDVFVSVLSELLPSAAWSTQPAPIRPSQSR